MPLFVKLKTTSTLGHVRSFQRVISLGLFPLPSNSSEISDVFTFIVVIFYQRTYKKYIKGKHICLGDKKPNQL